MKVTKQIFIVVFSLLLVGLFIFILKWGILNWSKVKDGMSRSGIYTETDIKTAYEDGYNQALADKAEYEKLIVYYRALIEQYEKELADLKKPKQSLLYPNRYGAKGISSAIYKER